MTDQAGKARDDPILEAARSAVLVQSDDLDEARFLKISGYDFNRGLELTELLNSFRATGFQASNLGDAMDIVNQMLSWTRSHEEPAEELQPEREATFGETTGCKIFLGFTSNLISSGIRETIRFLVEHKMVEVLVTTAGGIEEDLIKCLAPTFKGDFTLSGAYLSLSGVSTLPFILFLITVLAEYLSQMMREDIT